MFLNLKPKEAAAFYRLNLLSAGDMVGLALEWLNQGIDSVSVGQLAGEINPILSETGPLLEKSFQEQMITVPTELDAIEYTLRYVLERIVSGEIDPYDGMIFIDNHIYHKAFDNSIKQDFVGQCLGIERMYTWYRELQDANDGSKLNYYTELPRSDAIIKFKEHLIDEARKQLLRFAKT